MSRVCDVDEGRARRVAETHNVPAWYGDAGAMLAGSDFELAINLTPMRLHAPLNLQAVQAGRHVLCEKPIATDLGTPTACWRKQRGATSSSTGRRMP